MKTIFEFKLQSFSDIITNSSSELFTFINDDKETVEALIKAVYPDYRYEYEELINGKDLDFNLFEDFISRTMLSYKISYLESFALNNGYEPSDFYVDWNYIVEASKNTKYFFAEIKSEILEELRSKYINTWFLYSIDENPDWDMQERLETIGTRYHLG